MALTGRIPVDPNHHPVMGAVDSSTENTVYPLEIYTADGGLIVHVANGGTGGTASTFGQAFPGTGTAAGASDGTNMQPLLVDGSGNLKVAVESGGGGGTQYTDGGTPPTHPVGPTLIWDSGGTWEHVSTAQPLPVAASFSGSIGISQTTPGTTNNVSISGQSGSNTSNLIKDGTQYADSVTTGILAEAPYLWNGTNYDRQYGDKTNGAWVNIKNSTSIAVTGTFYQATQPVSLATNTPTLQSGSTTAVTQATASALNATVVPGTSTGSAIPAVAQPVGVEAVSADPTATTTTYTTIPIADLTGKAIVMPYSLPQNFQSGTATATGTSSTSLIPLVSSNKIYLTQVTIMNTGATTTYVNLQDGNGGTTKYVAPAPAGGGSVINLPTPIANTSGNAWYFAAGNSNTTLYVSATGYASKV